MKQHYSRHIAIIEDLEEDFVLEKDFNKLAEGVDTIKALQMLSSQYGVELPICNALYEVVFNSKDASQYSKR